MAGCIAAVNEILCDTPSVDFSQDRTARTGQFPEDALKAGRELELRKVEILTRLSWWKKCLQENTPTTWFGSMSGEVSG